MGIDKEFDKRKEVTPEEYEMIEEIKESIVEKRNYVSDLSILGNWYKKFYQGKGYLILKEIKDFQRIYEWS